MAAKGTGDFRAIDLGQLRRRLVDLDILRDEALEWTADSDVTSDAVLAAAVKTAGKDFTGSSVVYRPENRTRAIPLLQTAYVAATEPVERQNYATPLGLMGDATGIETLAAIVDGRVKIVRCKRPGAFGGGVNAMEGYMLALGLSKSPMAVKPLLKRLKAVTGGGIGAGLTDFGEEFFGNGLVEVLAYAAAGLDEVEHIFFQLKVKN